MTVNSGEVMNMTIRLQPTETETATETETETMLLHKLSKTNSMYRKITKYYE